MSATDLCLLSATELAAAIRHRRVSPVEVVEAVLDRIERLNPVLNAYCTVTAEEAQAAARVAEAAIVRRERVGPLHGVPVSVKDLVSTRGIRTTRGSLLYEHDVPAEDAPVVERLRAAGAIVVGKTNTPEFGFKGVTDNRVFGPTRNPWNRERTPGGSSGGAGAAVAAGLGPLAVGTDGGGSIRIPASFCGIFGIKPSVGRVPLYPVSPNGGLSQGGPMTRTVRDAALMLDAIAGPDERDRSSLPAPGRSFLGEIDGGIRGLRVGWSPDLGYAPVEPEVRAIALAAARRFEELGAVVEEVDPGFPDAAKAWAPLFQAAIGTVVGDHPDWREKVDPGLISIVELAQSLTAADLVRAAVAREALWDRVRRFFAEYDLLLTPAIAVPPFELGIEGPATVAGKPIGRLGWTPFTYPFNLTGQPAASVPCGWTVDGLPVGLQIVGRRYDDASVLRAAAAFEAIAPWGDRWPADIAPSTR